MYQQAGTKNEVSMTRLSKLRDQTDRQTHATKTLPCHIRGW